MKRPPKKELYSILGVDPSASEEEIRDAYLARARVIHPDRFDRQHQPQDWQKANEMLAELNEAYSILRHSSTRSEYDQIRSGKEQRHTATPPPRPEPEPKPAPEAEPDSESQSPPLPFEHGELTTGQANFADLPMRVRGRLRTRQENKGEEQFQVKLASIVGNYAFIALLLCWFWYLFANTDSGKWKEDALIMYAGLTLAVGLLLGQNIFTITRWTKATLKPYFYVTPIYFIKTEYDIVTFRPIWALKNVAVTHNHKNGAYQNSDVVLKFEGHDESVTLSSKQQVEVMFERMRTYDARLRAAYANRDRDYFRNNDDFFRVPRSGSPTTVLLSKAKCVFIYSASVFLCAVGLCAAIAVNEDFSQKRWVRHTTPTTPVSSAASSPQSHGGTLTPMPLGFDPFSKRVAAKTPPADPFAAKQQANSKSVVSRLDEVDRARAQQSLPFSGSILAYTTAARVAPFEIKAPYGSHYLLKLVDAYTHAPVLTVFVRGGTTVNIDVPLGTYEVRYASGDSWYGYEYLFGPDTAYSKADEKFTFEIVGNQYSGFTITLYKVPNGNLQTSAIRPTDF